MSQQIFRLRASLYEGKRTRPCRPVSSGAWRPTRIGLGDALFKLANTI